MTSLRIGSVVFIYIMVTLAWFILGSTIVGRTQQGYRNIGPEVARRWGSELVQVAPTAIFTTLDPKQPFSTPVELASSTVTSDLQIGRAHV